MGYTAETWDKSSSGGSTDGEYNEDQRYRSTSFVRLNQSSYKILTHFISLFFSTSAGLVWMHPAMIIYWLNAFLYL